MPWKGCTQGTNGPRGRQRGGGQRGFRRYSGCCNSHRLTRLRPTCLTTFTNFPGTILYPFFASGAKGALWTKQYRGPLISNPRRYNKSCFLLLVQQITSIASNLVHRREAPHATLRAIWYSMKTALLCTRMSALRESMPNYLFHCMRSIALTRAV